VGRVDRDIVHLGDHITRLQPGGDRRPRLVDRQDAATRGRPEQGGGLFCKHGARRPQGGDDQLPAGQNLLNVVLDIGGVQAESATRSLRRHGDADDLAPHIEQRAAGGPRIDDRVGLDCVADLQALIRGHWVGHRDRPMQRADDAAGHAAAIERACHRDHHLPLDQRGRVREGEGGQAADLVDLDHRHAGLAVVVDEPGLVWLGVAEHEHRKSARVGDDMHIGHDVAVAGGEVARPGADRWLQLCHDAHDRGLGASRGLDDGGVLGDGDARPEVHGLRVRARLELEHGKAHAARDHGRQQGDRRDQGD